MHAPDTSRTEVIRTLADLIVAVERPHPIRVAIDGRSGAGKSTLAGELAARIEDRGRCAIPASIDDFYGLWLDRHNRRYLTAETFYSDAYDYATLQRLLLEPLGPGGSRRCRTRWHDGWHEGVIEQDERTAPDDAILLLEGVFLLRPELDRFWDVRVFVDVDAGQSFERGVGRDLTLEEPALRDARRPDRVRVYRERYLPADERYLRAVNPLALADIVIDNRALDAPRLIVRRRPG
jgi:uridine kinase